MTSIAKGFLFSVGAYIGYLFVSLLWLVFITAMMVGLLFMILNGTF